jgi:hypothetical protein
VLPTVPRIVKGHTIRLTLTTSDTPHLLPTRTQAADLAGGIYAVQRNRAATSFVELPLAPAAEFPAAVPTPKPHRRRPARH